MPRISPLAEQRVRVHAPRELVFEVVAAAGKLIEDRGSERLMRFVVDVGGRKIATLELLTLDRPSSIRYRWIEGPLPFVDETIDFVEVAPDETDLVYRGFFMRAPIRPSSCLAAWFRVRRRFDAAATEHLLQAKRYAEARFARSHVYKDAARP